jgi:hypothetical protein
MTGRVFVLPKYSGGDIVTFCREDIAIPVYGEMKRQCGEYEIEHAEKVARHAEDILLPSVLKDAGVAAAWLHDVPELFRKRKGHHIDVFNPYSLGQRMRAREERKQGSQFINDSLSPLGSDGRHISYMVDRITYREELGRYEGYRRIIFKFKEDRLWMHFLLKLLRRDKNIRGMAVLTACNKTFDRNVNTEPEEERDIEPLMAEYRKKKGGGEKTLRHFYHVCGVEGTFRALDDFSYNEQVLYDAIMKKWWGKKLAYAKDNLEYFLPDAEDALWFFIPDDNALFDKAEMRGLLKNLYKKSLKILTDSGMPEEFDMYALQRMGNNRGRSRPGKTLLQELINERVKRQQKEARKAREGESPNPQ